jgi:hypothetical protein
MTSGSFHHSGDTGANWVNRMHHIVFIQSIYYLVTGIWPLVSMRTFEAVTGPKTDDWLVQTVGVLAAVIGVALFVGSRRPTPNRETLTLSVLSASGFIAVDVVFVALGTIHPIYLADVAVQVAIFSALAGFAFFGRQPATAAGQP